MCIGHCIGAGNVKEAKEYMRISNQIASLIIVTVCLGFAIFSKHIIQLFTSNQDVHKAYLSIVPLVTLSLFPDLW